MAMAEKNAKESLNRKLYETNNNKNLFEGVAKKFDLKKYINLVEVYDNSHISGTNSVGAMVTFGNEGFVKKRYRKFDIKTKGAEQDDFAMLKEVLTRRFKRAILEKGNYLTLPDLILIDGGKGQYSSAKEVLDEFGLHDLPMIAIAKGKMRNSGDETFFYNGKALNLKKMIQLYSLCKDLEMKLIDLQLPLIEQKEQKELQNHYLIKLMVLEL